MFTNLTYNLIHFSINLSYYLAGTPYKWNKTQHRLELVHNGKWTKLKKCISGVISGLFFFTSIYTYVAHLHQFGFELDTRGVINLSRLFCALISVVITSCTLTKCNDVVCMINYFIQICQEFKGISNKKTKMATCDIIIIACILFSLDIILTSGLLYLIDCEAHWLHIYFPTDVCEKDVLNPELDSISLSTTWVKLICLTFIQSAVYAHYLSNLGIAYVIVFPLATFTLDILHSFRTEDLKKATKFQHFHKTYKQLQLLYGVINSSNFRIIGVPWHFVIISIFFLIGMNTIIRQTASTIITQIFTYFCIGVALYLAHPIALFWRITVLSKDLVTGAKLVRTCKYYDQLILNTNQVLVFWVGSLGKFDKSLYVLIVLTLVENTINSLLV